MKQVVGTSKLVSELEFAAGIEGEKALFLDHVVNDEGEGEPAAPSNSRSISSEIFRRKTAPTTSSSLSSSSIAPRSQV